MSDRMTVHRDGKPIYDIVMEENYDRLGQEVASLSVRERRLCAVSYTHLTLPTTPIV